MIKSLLCLLTTTLLAQSVETPMERFKKRIGYESKKQVALTTTENNHLNFPGMVGKWPDMKSIPGLDLEWAINNYIIGEEHGSLAFHWILTRPKGRIQIDCYHYIKADESEKEFFIQANNSTMGDIPFTASSRNIGRLSASNYPNRGNLDGRTIVQNHNYCIVVRRSGSGIDQEAIADWLNAYAESKVVPDITPYIPIPLRVVLNPPSPRVGQEFEIRFEMPGENSSGRYILNEALYQDLPKFMDQFAAVGRDGLTPESLMEVLRAKKPGKGVYKYVLIDRETSLFHKGEIKIEIQP